MSSITSSVWRADPLALRRCDLHALEGHVMSIKLFPIVQNKAKPAIVITSLTMQNPFTAKGEFD